ncbi:MAG: tRNA (adenosine(37)-N6)-threonylcarbamoyltransferase complex ATPase subunit type 1 TsaE [Bryobacteraceae bacterium]
MSEDETIERGRELAAQLQRPCVILLIGNLGAGKTTLAKGIVEGLGAAAADEVSSPTFPLIHEYGNEVYHVDLYRLEHAKEVENLGLDDIIERHSVVLIEWGERFPQLWPRKRLEIHLTGSGESRELTVIQKAG